MRGFILPLMFGALAILNWDDVTTRHEMLLLGNIWAAAAYARSR